MAFLTGEVGCVGGLERRGGRDGDVRSGVIQIDGRVPSGCGCQEGKRDRG